MTLSSWKTSAGWRTGIAFTAVTIAVVYLLDILPRISPVWYNALDAGIVFAVIGTMITVFLCAYTLLGAALLCIMSADALQEDESSSLQLAVAGTILLVAGVIVALTVMMLPILREVTWGLWFTMAWLSAMSIVLIWLTRAGVFFATRNVVEDAVAGPSAEQMTSA